MLQACYGPCKEVKVTHDLLEMRQQGQIFLSHDFDYVQF